MLSSHVILCHQLAAVMYSTRHQQQTAITCIEMSTIGWLSSHPVAANNDVQSENNRKLEPMQSEHLHGVDGLCRNDPNYDSDEDRQVTLAAQEPHNRLREEVAAYKQEVRWLLPSVQLHVTLACANSNKELQTAGQAEDAVHWNGVQHSTSMILLNDVT